VIGREVYQGRHPDDWTETEHQRFPAWAALRLLEVEEDQDRTPKG